MAADTRAWWGQVGPYAASEVASSLPTPPARVVFGSRRLTLARDGGTCHLAVFRLLAALPQSSFAFGVRLRRARIPSRYRAVDRDVAKRLVARPPAREDSLRIIARPRARKREESPSSKRVCGEWHDERDERVGVLRRVREWPSEWVSTYVHCCVCVSVCVCVRAWPVPLDLSVRNQQVA